MNSATAERQTKTIAMAANFLRSAAMANSFDAQMIAMAFDGPPEIPILVTAPMFGPLIGHLELRSPGLICVRWTVDVLRCVFSCVSLFVRCVLSSLCVVLSFVPKTPSRSKSFLPSDPVSFSFQVPDLVAGSRAAAAVSFLHGRRIFSSRKLLSQVELSQKAREIAESSRANQRLAGKYRR